MTLFNLPNYLNLSVAEFRSALAKSPSKLTSTGFKADTRKMYMKKI